MKATGIVRNVDGLGRVVLPKELRRTLGIGEKDGLEIYVDEDKIILRKYEASLEKEEAIADLFKLQTKLKGNDRDLVNKAMALLER